MITLLIQSYIRIIMYGLHDQLIFVTGIQLNTFNHKKLRMDYLFSIFFLIFILTNLDLFVMHIMLLKESIYKLEICHKLCAKNLKIIFFWHLFLLVQIVRMF